MLQRGCCCAQPEQSSTFNYCSRSDYAWEHITSLKVLIMSFWCFPMLLIYLPALCSFAELTENVRAVLSKSTGPLQPFTRRWACLWAALWVPVWCVMCILPGFHSKLMPRFYSMIWKCQGNFMLCKALWIFLIMTKTPWKWRLFWVSLLHGSFVWL